MEEFSFEMNDSSLANDETRVMLLYKSICGKAMIMKKN